MDDLRKFSDISTVRLSRTIAIICILGYVLFNLTIPLVVGRAIDANWVDVSWAADSRRSESSGSQRDGWILSFSATQHHQSHLASY